MTAILDNDTAAAELLGKHHAPRVTERAARIMAYNQATLYVLKMSPYREIIRNSVDTHIETGVTDPVRVHLDFDRNTVTVEDNGSGLSLQELHDLVQSPGESSKSGADRKAGVVGRIGIGSLAMVKLADRVYFTSSKDGDETFVLRQEAREGGVDFSYERAAALGRRGTTVTAFLNDDLDDSHVDAIRWMLRFLPAGSVVMTTSRGDRDVVAGELRDENGALIRTAVTSRGTVGIVEPMRPDTFRYNNNLSYHDGSVLILNGHDPYDASALVRQAVEDIRRDTIGTESVLGEVLDNDDDDDDDDSFSTPLGSMSRSLLTALFYRYLHGAASTPNGSGTHPVLVIESDIDQYAFDSPRENMSITAANLDQMRMTLRAEADAFVEDMVRLYSVADATVAGAAYTKKNAQLLRSVAESENMFSIPNLPSQWLVDSQVIYSQEPYKTLFGISGPSRTDDILDKFSSVRDADEDAALLAVQANSDFVVTLGALESVYRQIRPNIDRLSHLRHSVARHKGILADKPKEEGDGQPVDLEYVKARLRDETKNLELLDGLLLRPKKLQSIVEYRTGKQMKVADSENTIVVVNCPPEVVSKIQNPVRFDKPGVVAAVEYLKAQNDPASLVVFTNAAQIGTGTAKASLNKSATLTTVDWKVLDVKAAEQREMIVSYGRSKRERKAQTAARSVMLTARAQDDYSWHPVSEEDFASQEFRKDGDGNLLDVVVMDLDYDDPKASNRWSIPRRAERNATDSRFFGIVETMSKSKLADLSSFVLVTTVKRGYRLSRLERELSAHDGVYRSDDYLAWFIGEVISKINPVLAGLDRFELASALKLHKSIKEHTERNPKDKNLVAVAKAIREAVPEVSEKDCEHEVVRTALRELAAQSDSALAINLLERVVALCVTPEDGAIEDGLRYHDATVTMAEAALKSLPRDTRDRWCDKFSRTLRDWNALAQNQLIASLGKNERRNLLRSMADSLDLGTE